MGLIIPGVSDARESKISGVSDTGDSFFFILFFDLQANLPKVGTPGIRKSPGSRKLRSQEFKVSGTPRSSF